MAEHLRELVSLFSLNKLNFNTANRKTLDNWVKKVKLQRRRQLLFETSCEKGKIKSRVALCKKQGRPGFSIELSTLSTKKLRAIIKNFLSELGLDNFGSLQKKNDKELEKLSLKKGWEKLLFMSDMNIDEVDSEKEGGMFANIPRQARRFRHSFLDEGAKPQREELFPEGRHKRGSPEKKKKPKKPVGGEKKKRSVFLKPPEQQAEDIEEFDLIPEQQAPSRRVVLAPLVPYSPDPSPEPSAEPRRSRTRTRSRSRSRSRRPPSPGRPHTPVIIPPQFVTPLRQEGDQRLPDPMHRGQRFRIMGTPNLLPHLQSWAEPIGNVALDSMEQAGVNVANLPRPPMSPSPGPFFATAPHVPVPANIPEVKKEEKKKPKEHHPKLPEIPAIVPSNMERQCYREKEFSDECSDCTPLDLTNIKLPRDARKELKYLSVQRKLVCERTALLKCKFDELRYQRMCWDLFSENASGDFFARIAKDKFKALDKCTPSTAYDTNEISRLRGILACYSDSQKVCKGYHQIKAKEHKDTSKLGPNFTLPTLRYDQLEKEQKTETKDRFLDTALRNREPEHETGYKKVCEKEQVVPPIVPNQMLPLDKKLGALNSLTAPGVIVQKPGTAEQKTGLQQNLQRVPPVADPRPTGQHNIPPVQARPAFGPFPGGGAVGGRPQRIVGAVPSLGAFQSEESELPRSDTIHGEQALQKQWLDAGIMDLKLKIERMRIEGKSEQAIVNWFNSLPGESKLTVDQLAQEFPQGAPTVQNPSSFHFQRFANSPTSLKSAVSVPLPDDHSHVHPQETPAQQLLRATGGTGVPKLPAPEPWATATFPSGSLATEIAQPVSQHDSWEQVIKDFQTNYPVPKSPEAPAKQVQFFGAPPQTSPTVPEKGAAAGRGFDLKKKKKEEPKRKSLVGELFKRQKKEKRTRSSTPKKRKPKTPKRSKSSTPKKTHRLPKETSGWDDDDPLVTETKPVTRITRQPSIRRKRYFR